MKQANVNTARNKFGTLLDWVEQGEEVVITRRGKLVARLAPAGTVRVGPRVNPEEARAASQRIRERAKQLTGKVTLEELLAWRHESR